jgi:uncharacterized protein YjbI with pentapeptide repeats
MGTQQRARQGQSGETRLWSIGAALSVSFTVAFLGLAGLGLLTWALLGLAGYGKPSLHDAVGIAQLVFASVAGAGALVALVVAYRRQKVAEADSSHDRIRVFNERFTTAASQLGDVHAAVRLAGVYAMAGLADDWKENQQTCIDVLCAYLRLPYDPDPGDKADRAAYTANREVRNTVLRLIGNHLRPAAAVSWTGRDFDFTGVVFDGLANFSDAKFSGGRVRFDDAEFAAGRVHFDNAEFCGGQDSLVSFNHARFVGGEVYFSGAKFSASRVHFMGAEFSDGRVTFSSAEFCGGQDSLVSFNSAKFSGGEVWFSGTKFSGGEVSFVYANFSGSMVSFIAAEFSGGEVSFNSATFSGGEVIFAPYGDWSHPPAFEWGDKAPPPGVRLPLPS